MIGNYWINIWVSAGAALLTFFVTLSNNVLAVAVERTFYSLVIFFLASYLFRWVLALIIGHESSTQGSQIDMVTPEDSEAEHAQSADQATDQTTDQTIGQTTDQTVPPAKNNASEEFTPLQPPRISREEISQPASIANALRRFSDD